jgi:hypothetical protein
VKEVVKAAKDHGCSMRIGVNAGSLERDLLEKYGEPCPEAMVESALNHAKHSEDNDFHEFKISVKASDVFLAVAAYQQLAEACDYPLHLGITEAGGLMRSGTVKSSIGMGMLLWAGIGDTIRVSLSADPVEEVKVGFDMLKSLGLRHRGVNIISCPSCARQGFNVIETVRPLEERLKHIDADDAVDHRLRGQRPGRGARDRSRLHRRRRGHAELRRDRKRYSLSHDRDAIGRDRSAGRRSGGDSEMRALAEQERQAQRKTHAALERELQMQLLPKDAADESSAIVEIRAGTGGDEAALFAADLLGCISVIAQLQGWKTEILSPERQRSGRRAEAVMEVVGQGAYAKLKFESGVHRVQRVPVTEAGAHPHLGGDGGRAAGGGGCRRRRSMKRICASTSIAPAAPAASTSTRPKARCASRICRPASWWRSRKKNRSTRTAPRR